LGWSSFIPTNQFTLAMPTYKQCPRLTGAFLWCYIVVVDYSPPMSDIILIEDVEVLQSTETDQVELRIVALISDLVQTSPAVVYPPGISEPAQFGPARAVTTVTVDLENSDLEWEVLEQ